MEAWWRAVTPHADIREGRVDEGLFDAKLAHVVQGGGPPEYHDTRLFLAKTYFTQGLKELLTQVLGAYPGMTRSMACSGCRQALAGARATLS